MDCGPENRKYCNFNKLIIKEFLSTSSNCKAEGDMSDFVCFLCKKNIIKNKTMYKYLVIKAFDILYPKNDNHKTNTVIELASIFEVHENTIWSTLKYNEFSQKVNSKDKYSKGLECRRLENLIKEKYFCN